MGDKWTRKTKKLLYSEKPNKQIFGAIRERRLNMVLACVIGVMLLFALVLAVLDSFSKKVEWCVCPCLLGIVKSPWYWIVVLTSFVVLVFLVCSTLRKVYNLRKKEKEITRCYVAMLVSIGIWVVGYLLLFHINKDSRYYVAIVLVGTLLTWIFQDKIRGAVTYFHLRMIGQLNIGDWIMVPSMNVDGEVKHITLTTVTIYNWDTTTSVIPISALSSGHFKNLQKMTAGKTYGRRMLRSFVFDTSWFKLLDSEAIEGIIQKHSEVEDFLPEEERRGGALNAHIYRIYLYHWLMRQPYVSQLPRLIVRWEEQLNTGMPLQVYAYITEGSLAQFERKQSLITEHIIESMKWFNLRLYQSPSAFDALNDNVYMTDKPATYREDIEL